MTFVAPSLDATIEGRAVPAPSSRHILFAKSSGRVNIYEHRR